MIFYFTLMLSSCTVSKRIAKQAEKILFTDTAVRTGNIGISIYEPATGKYWYNYRADKYFIPASNTKLFTLYAGMKYLGDSLVGMKFTEFQNRIMLIPTGDPTFLHPSFSDQPVFRFLTSTNKILCGSNIDFKTNAYGSGWAWDDYNESFLNERSQLPVFGNVVVFSGNKNDMNYFPKAAVDLPVSYASSNHEAAGYINKVIRDYYQNTFTLQTGGNKKVNVVVPFITSGELAFKILSDTLHKKIVFPNAPPLPDETNAKNYRIYSRPTDSLFKPMIQNSDNFFAEQTLLMASNALLGFMSDDEMIDTLMKTDLKDVPQKPKWVDGSGLSRYNLFTPQSFIYILNKIKNEFGIERLKIILPTGGTGTLKNYYISDSSFIYAKTGSLSNNSALSGFLITQKGKLLIFSILANNYITGAAPVRRAVEHFLKDIRKKY